MKNNMYKFIKNEDISEIKRLIKLLDFDPNEVNIRLLYI